MRKVTTETNKKQKPIKANKHDIQMSPEWQSLKWTKTLKKCNKNGDPKSLLITQTVTYKSLKSRKPLKSLKSTISLRQQLEEHHDIITSDILPKSSAIFRMRLYFGRTCVKSTSQSANGNDHYGVNTSEALNWSKFLNVSVVFCLLSQPRANLTTAIGIVLVVFIRVNETTL